MEVKHFYEKVKSLNFISHRLGFLMTDYPENSLEVLNEIFKNSEMLDSCSGFEFDICFTKDNVPVVIHDKYVDDISDHRGFVRDLNIKQLQEITFNFRKSLDEKRSYGFKIVTLEDILIFFSSHKRLLKDKVIKIETKNVIVLSRKRLEILADIIHRFPDLSENIIHLSFFPTNLVIFKQIQKKRKYSITKADLLCDYKQLFWLTKFIRSIDLVSFRVKTKQFPKLNGGNSKRVNKKIFLDTFFMKFSNAIGDETIRSAIERCGSVGVYVLNDDHDVTEFCSKISDETFFNYCDKIYFTTDNPLYFRK